MTPKHAHSANTAREAGSALFFVIFILLLLGGVMAAIGLRTLAESKSNASYQSAAQAYYSSLSGLEEARTRVLLSAPDTISSTQLDQLRNRTRQRIYILNNTPGDTVDPTDVNSRYYDSQYLLEFPGSTDTPITLSSNQPNAGTSFALRYKWVRITLKTEFSSQQDVDGDSTLDPNNPVVLTAAGNQALATATICGKFDDCVYKITALAVEGTGAQRLYQYEVAGPKPPVVIPPAITTLGAVVAGDDIELSGPAQLDGTDYCNPATSQLAAISAGAITPDGGYPPLSPLTPAYLENQTLPAPSPADLINELVDLSVPILDADPMNVSFTGGAYSGNEVDLPNLPGAFPPLPPPVFYPPTAIAHADQSLDIDGGEGAGILLVEGDLSLTGRFNYYGLIIVTGDVTITATGGDRINLYGQIYLGGQLNISASGGGTERIDIVYASCAVTVGVEPTNPDTPVPKTILTFRSIFR